MALNNLGVALEGQDRLHEAAAAFASAVERQQQALSLQPQLPRAYRIVSKIPGQSEHMFQNKNSQKRLAGDNAPAQDLKRPPLRLS